MRPKLIQVIYYHDYLVGLDNEGRLWKIYTAHGYGSLSMTLLFDGEFPK